MNLIDRMANDLIIDKEFIIGIANNSNSNYSRYIIKKKNGGYRQICHPSPVLKAFQYWLVNNLFCKFNISNHAYAYRKGYSIKRNAACHLGCNHILHLDICNFFESITDSHLIRLFEDNKLILKDLGVSTDDINIILKLCLYNRKLTIGSVCSPMISNCVMFKFDKEVYNNIPEDIIYTRYADDMVFSSKQFIDDKLINTISDMLEQHKFFLNHNKTRFMSNKGRKAVTGLIIDNNRVSVGLKKRRYIKSMLYNKLIHGKGNSREILGHLYYLKDIEPNYFNSLIIKYSCYGNIINILISDIAKENESSYDEVTGSIIHEDYNI